MDAVKDIQGAFGLSGEEGAEGGDDDCLAARRLPNGACHGHCKRRHASNA